MVTLSLTLLFSYRHGYECTYGLQVQMTCNQHCGHVFNEASSDISYPIGNPIVTLFLPYFLPYCFPIDIHMSAHTACKYKWHASNTAIMFPAKRLAIFLALLVTLFEPYFFPIDKRLRVAITSCDYELPLPVAITV